MQPRFALALTSVLAAACGVAAFQAPQPPSPTISRAAQEFLAALAPAERAAATAALEDPARQQWNFVPMTYPGLMLGGLGEPARSKARALLGSVLSERGLAKVDAIVALEDVLHALESAAGQDASHRDPRRYWLQVFGAPAAETAWAFRLQGHHVSLHFAVVHDQLIAATPRFLGANPHQVEQGPRRGERVLAAEEDLARALLALCDEAQRAQAIVAVDAPADIVLGPTRRAIDAGAARGLRYAAMGALQRDLLWRLIEEYVRVERAESADAELARIRAHGLDAIAFAWMGGTGRGEGHYYRVQGPTFVLEYDNTQNHANHVHTVYRDLEHDFGGDALREHYAHEHGKAAAGK